MRRDPIEHQIELALRPGAFIPDRTCFSFVSELESVVALGTAARLWRAHGMCIVKAGKSKYYDAAISDFERARRCYARAGLAADPLTPPSSRVHNRFRTKLVWIIGAC
jgi:hypothetical protein